jgi:hypothetical protein
VQENLTKGEKANLTISITFNSLFTQSIQPQPILNPAPKSQPITSTYEEREDGLKKLLKRCLSLNLTFLL